MERPELGEPACRMDQQQERDRRRTLLLVNLASIMERADETLLPAVYREVGAALHASPAGLGALSLCRSIVQQPVRLAGSFRCWFVKKSCLLVCIREKYCSGWKFTIVYDKTQPNDQAAACYPLATYAAARHNHAHVIAVGAFL